MQQSRPHRTDARRVTVTMLENQAYDLATVTAELGETEAAALRLALKLGLLDLLEMLKPTDPFYARLDQILAVERLAVKSYVTSGTVRPGIPSRGPLDREA